MFWNRKILVSSIFALSTWKSTIHFTYTKSWKRCSQPFIPSRDAGIHHKEGIIILLLCNFLVNSCHVSMRPSPLQPPIKCWITFNYLHFFHFIFILFYSLLPYPSNNNNNKCSQASSSHSFLHNKMLIMKRKKNKNLHQYCRRIIILLIYEPTNNHLTTI